MISKHDDLYEQGIWVGKGNVQIHVKDMDDKYLINVAKTIAFRAKEEWRKYDNRTAWGMYSMQSNSDSVQDMIDDEINAYEQGEHEDSRRWQDYFDEHPLSTHLFLEFDRRDLMAEYRSILYGR